MFSLFIFPCFHSCIVYTVLWIGFLILNISSLFLKLKPVLCEFVVFIKTSWDFKRSKCYVFFFPPTCFCNAAPWIFCPSVFWGQGRWWIGFSRVLLCITESWSCWMGEVHVNEVFSAGDHCKDAGLPLACFWGCLRKTRAQRRVNILLSASERHICNCSQSCLHFYTSFTHRCSSLEGRSFDLSRLL